MVWIERDMLMPPLPILSSMMPKASQKPGAPRSPQPYSTLSLQKGSRLQNAVKVDSICCYCAVGCATNIYVKDGQVIDVEGNPKSPINEGTLCPKGANIFQLEKNAHRVKHAMYRAPYSDHWKIMPLEWAMDQIAHAGEEDAR